MLPLTVRLTLYVRIVSIESVVAKCYSEARGESVFFVFFAVVGAVGEAFGHFDQQSAAAESAFEWGFAFLRLSDGLVVVFG